MDNLAEELRILWLEDVPSDAELQELALREAGVAFSSLRVDTREAFEQALDKFKPNIVLADYRLPNYNGREALEYTCRTHPHVPVIMVTGALGDEAAVELLRLGARDYMLKDRLTRLPQVVERVLQDQQKIIERNIAENSLRLFRALLDQSPDAIEIIDPSTMRLIDVNDGACRALGYVREELLTKRAHDIDPEQEKVFAPLQQYGQVRVETTHLRKDGTIFPVEVFVTRVALDKPYFLSIARDITERKRAEDALRRTNRALQTLSAGNMALVHVSNEQDLLRAVTEVIVEKGGYSLAVVDYADAGPQKELRPATWSGMEQTEYWGRDFTWDDAERGQLPAAKAVRSGITQICHDVSGEAGFEPWRAALQARNYASNIALPLRGNGKMLGCLSIYSVRKEDFEAEEIELLEEFANDLAYGIINLRVRRQHEQHAAILHNSLEQFVQAIASTIEARDPYTAGHQKRVSSLAAAIAKQMGLPDEQINGIQLAATIHDLGKIRVPAEILAKPGKLDDVEFMLIKAHPLAGYEIVKDIEFPWPIARIILEHHEKLDGSGYPHGLRDEQIMLESRILTVADVVEAMSSHRPYRAALGVEAALEEIRRGCGSAYDPEVVDACLKVIAETGFSLA